MSTDPGHPLLAHEQSLAAFGGPAGIRDEGLLDSALGKPQNLFAYGKPTLFSLAASYALGLVKNHPFIDGNKRAGFVVAVLSPDEATTEELLALAQQTDSRSTAFGALNALVETGKISEFQALDRLDDWKSRH